MKSNSLFAILAVLAVLAFLPESGKSDVNTRNAKVLSKTDPADVTRIRITPKIGESLIMSKQADIWNVESYNNFPADPSKISQFLQNLFLLKMGERETSGLKFFDDYGVNVDGAAKGLLLSLEKADGTVLNKIVLGNDRMGKGQYGFDTPIGQYMRIDGQEEIYLLKERFSVETIASNWIHKKLPVIASENVQQILIGSGPDSVELMRLEAKDELKVAGLEAEQVMNKSRVDQLANVFKDFNFNNLEKPDSVAALKSMTNVSKFEVSTFDGMRLSVEMGVKTTASSYRFARLQWSELNASQEVKDKILAYNNLYKDWLVAFSDYSGKNLFPSRADLISSKPLGAKHILLSYKGASNSDAERSKQEALELANKIIADLKSGQDFEKLAADYSDDKSNKNQGGNLGDFSKGDMVKPFEDATYALAIGQMTDAPVETVYGYHIIQRTK